MFLTNESFFFGSIRSLLLCLGLLWLWWRGGRAAALHWSAWTSHWGGSSCCGAASRACGLQHSSTRVSTCGVRVPGTRASLAVVCVLRGSAACGIFSDQGLNPCPLHRQVHSYPLSHQQSSQWVLNEGKKYLNPFLPSNITSLVRPAPAMPWKLQTPLSLGAPNTLSFSAVSLSVD